MDSRQLAAGMPSAAAAIDSGQALWPLLCAHIGAPRPRADTRTAALAPVARLLYALGQPQRRLPVIHIAGSKGKGSTAVFCESALRACGLKTGLFVSPHFSDWRERFQINGCYAAPDLLSATARALRGALASGRHEGLGFFDLATAAALYLFDRAGVDCAVIETGIGGLLDATNIVRPRVCAITSIEHEHCDRLGSSLTAIARHKAGIIKPAVPVIVGPIDEPALGSIMRCAARNLAPVETVATADPALDLPHADPHAALNATLALRCMLAGGWLTPSSIAAVREAVRATRLPGRCEILSRDPFIVVDGAHTPSSARALARTLDGLGRPCRWVVAMKPDKHAEEIFAALLGVGDELILTCVDAGFAAADDLFRQLPAAWPSASNVTLIDDPGAALSFARNTQRPGQLLCATGSVYLAGMARDLWRSAADAAWPLESRVI